MQSNVHVYTDGSCLGNGKQETKCGAGLWYPSRGGDGVSVKLRDTCTTNNAAELDAILFVLCTNVGTASLTIHTDSMYSINSICVWSKSWVKNDWLGGNGAPVANADTIKCILRIMKDRASCGGTTEYVHVKGHSGDEGNSHADKCAKAGAELDTVDRRVELLCKSGVRFH
ncbi:uncharacterized protein EAF01_010864 [Botrytis porri]|uniref:uncharacterized protein n=1 Tax=Botrytis porri TaxID=87229 RepID=UPI0018FFB574|nr:uncharacterized protein EAF01_010864 [Botrytis porri]KAF7889371.1 hypothetical protein EAF01_010864 [Botrytis porri]